jgi:hypothetical protein
MSLGAVSCNGLKVHAMRGTRRPLQAASCPGAGWIGAIEGCQDERRSMEWFKLRQGQPQVGLGAHRPLGLNLFAERDEALPPPDLVECQSDADRVDPRSGVAMMEPGSSLEGSGERCLGDVLRPIGVAQDQGEPARTAFGGRRRGRTSGSSARTRWPWANPTSSTSPEQPSSSLPVRGGVSWKAV